MPISAIDINMKTIQAVNIVLNRKTREFDGIAYGLCIEIGEVGRGLEFVLKWDQETNHNNCVVGHIATCGYVRVDYNV